MDKAQLAHEAKNLKDNEIFQRALDRMRASAVEGLIAAKPTDAETIRDHQAKVRVVDELRSNIEAFIRDGQPRRASGIV